jgi:hypothetical protein
MSSTDFRECDLIDGNNIKTFPDKFFSILDIASQVISVLSVCLFKLSKDVRVGASKLSLPFALKTHPTNRLNDLSWIPHPDKTVTRWNEQNDILIETIGTRGGGDVSGG